MMLPARATMALEALVQASGGEWVEADTVLRRMRELAPELAPKSPAAMGRILSSLADDGFFERSLSAVSSYRMPMRAIEVFDRDGVLRGRLLLMSPARGLVLDLGQLVELLAESGHRVVLGERDIRTLRAAADETLWKGTG